MTELTREHLATLGRARTSALLWLASAATLWLGCAPEGSPHSAATPPDAASAPLAARPLAASFDAAGRFVLDPKILAAPRRDPRYRALKADAYDDIRFATPENYAITQPPARIATVRPMAEYEAMRAIVMSYPSGFMEFQNATDTVVQIAKYSAAVGEVWFLVDTLSAENALKARLLAAGLSQGELTQQVKFFQTDFDSIWFIDFGPLPIIDTASDTFAFVDFRYYRERALDDGLPTVLGRDLASLGYDATATVYRAPYTTEGGTFQSTSDGICFTANRQLYYRSCDTPAGCDESIRVMPLAEVQTHPLAVQMRQILAEYAGCVDLIITNSITDDGTGHLDMFLKVLDDDRVLVGAYLPPFANQEQQTNAPRLDANADFIEAYIKPDGTHFSVERLPMPGHRSSNFGEIPFTYINSTFFNGLNLWPATDLTAWEGSRAAAQAVWEEVLPGMTHIWIDATELSFYSGAIHCITRTIPALEAGAWIADGACTDGSCAAPEGGYDGACRPGDASRESCWGPDWICECNDCDGTCELPADPCGGVSYRGCCEGGDLRYCEAQTLYSVPCQGGCGWDEGSGFYNCGVSGADPSGSYPIACDGGSCEPDCEIRECGGDGCGGSCGTCDDGGVCLDGVCRDDCAACDLGEIGCEAEVAWLCVASEEEGCNQRERVDCGASGRLCVAGDCVSPVAEPEPDASGGDAPTADDTDIGADIGPTLGDAAPTSPERDSSASGDVSIGADASPLGIVRRDEGCAGGSGAPAWPVAGGALLIGAWASRRRRSAFT